MSVFTSPWIPAVVLLLLACGARVIAESWLAPSAFSGLLWATFVWVSMLATDYPIYASAVWVIVLFVLVLQVGAFIGESVVGGRPGSMIRQDEAQSNSIAANSHALRFCVAFALIALAGSIYFVFWSFRWFDLPASPISFLGLGHLWSVQRYEYGELDPWPVRLTIMWLYPAAFLGGIAFATTSSIKTKRWSLLPFLPALLNGAVAASRLGLLMSSICWLSGYLGVKHWQTNGRYTLFRRRLVLLLIAFGVTGLVLFLLVDAIRQSKDAQAIELTLDVQRLLKYSFGSLAAFSSWFHQYTAGNATLGAYTFGGIFDLLGVHPREIGLYAEAVTLPGGEETNIYTALRGLIQDFSLGGAVLVAFVMSFVSGMLLSRPTRRAWISICFASAYFAFVLCSPLTSIFTYNSLLLAWLVGAVVLRFHFKVCVDRVAPGLPQGPFRKPPGPFQRGSYQAEG
jgi:oligosaccharide repeat unit polymerase